MPRFVLAGVWLVVCLVSPLPAQEGLPSRSAADSADALVLDHDFIAGVGEFVRVFLQGKQVYRAELSTTDVTIGIHSPLRRVQLPRVYQLTDSHTPSGSSVVEIYPEEDAEYELRPLDARGGGIATRLRLYRDVRASRRRVAIIERPGWEIGMEVAGGWHSGFDQSPDQAGDAGSDFEACFAARSAPGVDRLSLCALGLGWGSQHGARSTLWFYTEPRYRILGRFERGRSNWEMGALFRLAAGSIERSSAVPVMLAPGIYVARHIRTSRDGSGWSLHGSYAYATIRNSYKLAEGRAPTTSRLLFGVGWYQ
ncbi:MAG: hypothetical protein ACREM9_06870 [Gemmatimonadales bacterium]